MTEQTNTERNEALYALDKTLEEYESKYAESVGVKERIKQEPEVFTWKWEDGGYWVSIYKNSPKYIKELQAAITALRSQSEAERKIERIKNVMEYFAESGNHARALYIIQCILDGMTDEEIMEGN